MAQAETVGLRERQKQQREEYILKCAKRLFEENGFEETTMASIAVAANVSTPTVFNYFGNRDQLFLAIILKGHEEAVENRRRQKGRQSDSLSDDVCALLTSFTEGSLEIFSKSVWRYADSTVIRQPNSEFVQQYVRIDTALKNTIKERLVAKPCKTRRGGDFDSEILAQVLFHTWNQNYIAYIKDDEMTLEAHLEVLLPQVRELLDLIFEDA